MRDLNINETRTSFEQSSINERHNVGLIGVKLSGHSLHGDQCRNIANLIQVLNRVPPIRLTMKISEMTSWILQMSPSGYLHSAVVVVRMPC